MTKLNAAISSTPELQGKSLEEIMATATGGVFNNAAQVKWHLFHGNMSIDRYKDATNRTAGTRVGMNVFFFNSSRQCKEYYVPGTRLNDDVVYNSCFFFFFFNTRNF